MPAADAMRGAIVPILNYTTEVSPAKTVAELQKFLNRRGAVRVSIDYGPDGDPAALGFAMVTDFGVQTFRIEPNVDGVLAALKR
jgi:hypothetical protein